MSVKYAICIPTYNAGFIWEEVLRFVNNQDLPGLRKMVVDSGSSDDTVKLAKAYGFEVQQIRSSEFNHGATRQLMADTADDCDICIFLTQDAILASPDSISNLVKAYEDPAVGIAFGRQLPRKNAKPVRNSSAIVQLPETSNVTFC
jgi:rhamnosyltransferase